MDTLSQRLSMEICIIIILLVTVKKVKASSYSCDETKKTVEIVDDCPDSAEKWKKAAARKNCSAHANQCNDPERFLYHCVINAYANQTLEVCAYAQNIVSGYCTEYNVLGNLIQSSLRTSCREFNIKPCPIFYRSNESYKYPVCYELTKASTTLADETKSTINQVTHTPAYVHNDTFVFRGNAILDESTTQSDIPENDAVTESPSRLFSLSSTIPSIIISIIITIIIIITITRIFIWKTKFRACFGKLKSKDCIAVECPENCDVVFIPSTDNIDGEIRSITLLKVEEKEVPDVSINEKEREKEESLMML